MRALGGASSPCSIVLGNRRLTLSQLLIAPQTGGIACVERGIYLTFTALQPLSLRRPSESQSFDFF